MNLLKIGNLDIQPEKWTDATCVFDRIYVLGIQQNISNFERVLFCDMEFTKTVRLLLKIQARCNRHRFLNSLSVLCLKLIRRMTKKQLLEVAEMDYDEILVSYSDYDYSSLLLYLIAPYLKRNIRITRAYKETRSTYNFLEMMSFKLSNRIVLNSEYNKSFLEKKYNLIFDKKDVVLNIDEDYRQSQTQEKIQYAKKLSSYDNKIHAVILAGRVLSDKKERRSGSRLYYVDLIEKLLACGMVVHLQTKTIVPYKNYNPYHEIAIKNSDFVIENSINFSENRWKSYNILSQYDIGILHAHANEDSSYFFDKVNLPHRYFEYELAHVVPIDIKGENILVDKKAEEGHALVVNDFAEISFEMLSKIVWEYPTFVEYISTLY